MRYKRDTESRTQRGVVEIRLWGDAFFRPCFQVMVVMEFMWVVKVFS